MWNATRCGVNFFTATTIDPNQCQSWSTTHLASTITSCKRPLHQTIDCKLKFTAAAPADFLHNKNIMFPSFWKYIQSDHDNYNIIR